MPKLNLATAPTAVRTEALRGFDGSVDPESGDFGAGLIRGLAVITRGEALGHGEWIDAEFLKQTAAAINASGSKGIKARYTHPDDSGDGLGSYLGRVKDARIEGDTVRADLHLASAAHNSPDGNLASYVMDLALEDPDAFGESIAFQRDLSAEDDFATEHSQAVKLSDFDGEKTVYRFKSPDKLNTRNLPHVRLAELRAVDTVDEPAANPSGLFHRASAAAEADALLSYALGHSSERPTLTTFDADPDRVSGFLNRWLTRKGLELTAKATPETPPSEPGPTPDPMEDAMSQDATTPEVDETPTAPEPAPSRSELLSEVRQELAKFTGRFGAENGAAWFNAGKDYAEALELHADALAEQLAAQTEKVAELEQQLKATAALGADPLDADPPPVSAPKQQGLAAAFPSSQKATAAVN